MRYTSLKKAVWSILLFTFGFAVPLTAYCEKVTIVYTGNTYAALYPCGHCPASVGGGIARRAETIKNIRANSKNVIVLDSGNLSAGGPLDEARINPAMDKKRTSFYYSAIAKIAYDALGLGETEFNFDVPFLQENLKEYKLPFVSSNVALDGVLPYYIKEFAPEAKTGKKSSPVRIAVIGLSPLEIYKKSGVKVDNYEASLTKTLAQLKGKADYVILLSALGDAESVSLAEKFTADIHVVICSGPSLGGSPAEKIKNTLILRPTFRGRDLGIVELTIAGNKIVDWKADQKRLALDVPEDQKTKNMLPACFVDGDCPRKDALVSVCQKPGNLNSVCAYFEAAKIEATVITDAQCAFCSTTSTEQVLKQAFLGINFKTLNYEDAQAQELIKKYGITTIPAFILPAQIKEEKNFEVLSKLLEAKQGNFLVRRELGGLFLFLNRKETKGKIDFFLDMYDKKTTGVYADLLDFARKNKITLEIHLLVPPGVKTDAPKEEIKIALAVKKLYPAKFHDYLRGRLQTMDSIYWMEILEKLGIDYKKITALAKSRDGENLLKENNKLGEELGVADGNVLLINNRRIFKVFTISAEDLMTFFK